jgi:hypothetical protein
MDANEIPSKSPQQDHGRIAREKRTVAAMVHIYCRAQHGVQAGLCDDCRALLDYAECRLDRCPFGAGKTSCNQCPVHCYQKDRREQIRQVMRFAGPRMLYRHPWLALLHWWDEWRGRPNSG